MNCLFCGEPCWPEDRVEWHQTVNLTPDHFLMGAGEGFHLEEVLPLAGYAEDYNWCKLECFARWCWNHARQDTTARRLIEAVRQ